MLVFELSPAQILQQHTREVMLPTYVRNIRVQCKAFGFVRNKQHEGIICFAIIHGSTIPYTNVLIWMDEDVAYIGLVNKKPKV